MSIYLKLAKVVKLQIISDEYVEITSLLAEG